MKKAIITTAIIIGLSLINGCVKSDEISTQVQEEIKLYSNVNVHRSKSKASTSFEAQIGGWKRIATIGIVGYPEWVSTSNLTLDADSEYTQLTPGRFYFQEGVT